MPAAASARAAPHQSAPNPSGSKIGPGETISRLSRAGRVAARPPNGGSASCIALSADLRKTGTRARSARERSAAMSIPANWPASAGALGAAAPRISRRRANAGASRPANSSFALMESPPADHASHRLRRL
jgi:hypothetical protein